MLTYPLILVSYDVKHVENTPSVTQLWRNTHRWVTALEPVQMRALEHEITRFPRVVTIAPLAQPPFVIRLADLFQDAPVRFESAGPRGCCDSR